MANNELYNQLISNEARIDKMLAEEQVSEGNIEEAREDCYLMLLERMQDGVESASFDLSSIVRKVAAQYHLQRIVIPV